jgi:hypothetical protein
MDDEQARRSRPLLLHRSGSLGRAARRTSAPPPRTTGGAERPRDRDRPVHAKARALLAVALPRGVVGTGRPYTKVHRCLASTAKQARCGYCFRVIGVVSQPTRACATRVAEDQSDSGTLSACSTNLQNPWLSKDFHAGGGTRTPDTRIMIPGDSGLAIGHFEPVGHGFGHMSVARCTPFRASGRRFRRAGLLNQYICSRLGPVVDARSSTASAH